MDKVLNRKQVSAYKVYVAVAITVLTWASAFVGIRYALQSFDGGSLALLRYAIASVAMFAILALQKRLAFPGWPTFLKLMGLGALGFGVYNVALNYGEVTIPASTASFIVSLIPVMIILMASAVLKETLSRQAIAGMLLSLLGIVIIAIANNVELGFNYGISSVLLAMLAGSFYSILQKPLLKRMDPLLLCGYAVWGGTFMMLIYLPRLWHELPNADWHATAAVIYMGIFPAALGYACWSYALENLPAATAGGFLFIMPLITTLLSFLIIHEKPSPLSLIGGVIALVGAVIASRGKQIQRNSCQTIPPAS